MDFQHLNTLQFQTRFLLTQNLASKKNVIKLTAHPFMIRNHKLVNHTLHCTMLSPSCTLPHFSCTFVFLYLHRKLKNISS
jgi:hypothetical protein